MLPQSYKQLTDLAVTRPLPDEPDEPRAQDCVLSAYRRRWGIA